MEHLLNHAVPFLLVLFRLGGLMIFAPILGSPMIPARARVLVAFMFAVALYPAVAAVHPAIPVRLDLLTLGPLVAAETAIGLTIGLLAALPMYAVQLGGQVIGQQMGMGLASIYNPALDTESDVIGQLLMFVALAVFAGIGGLEMMFLAVAETFTRIPPGGALEGLPVAATGELVMNLVASGFQIALRVSAPVLCIILVETIAMAFLMKTLPQLNLLSVGFALKVILALVVMVWAIGAIGESIGHEVMEACGAFMRWSADAGPGR